MRLLNYKIISWNIYMYFLFNRIKICMTYNHKHVNYNYYLVVFLFFKLIFLENMSYKTTIIGGHMCQISLWYLENCWSGWSHKVPTVIVQQPKLYIELHKFCSWFGSWYMVKIQFNADVRWHWVGYHKVPYCIVDLVSS